MLIMNKKNRFIKLIFLLLCGDAKFCVSTIQVNEINRQTLQKKLLNLNFIDKEPGRVSVTSMPLRQLMAGDTNP